MYSIPTLKVLLVAALIITFAAVGSLSSSNVKAQQPLAQNLLPPYLTIKLALIRQAGLDALIHTNGVIPKDGSGGAFGYGIITKQGLGAVIVSTTHEDVRDSSTQGQDSGPIWHNHFVSLGSDPNCGSDPGVLAITLQQPGRIAVIGNDVVLQGIPPRFTGTNALNGQPLTLSPSHDVQRVVSFTLLPKFDDQGGLEAVCVQNIHDAQRVIKA